MTLFGEHADKREKPIRMAAVATKRVVLVASEKPGRRQERAFAYAGRLPPVEGCSHCRLRRRRRRWRDAPGHRRARRLG